MSKMQRRIFIAGGDSGYVNWCEPTHIVRNIKEADLVCFTGGTDVDSRLYNQKPHPQAQAPDEPRDRREEEIFQEAVGLCLPMLGICRGSQFLCVMNGGELVQHMRHPSPHLITTFDGQKLKVTSSHHQAQYPWLMDKADYKLIGWADDLSPIHENGDQKEIGNGNAGLLPWKSVRDNLPEVEICYYTDTRALCVQAHPEWMDFSDAEDRKTIHYLRGLLDDLMNFKL